MGMRNRPDWTKRLVALQEEFAVMDSWTYSFYLDMCGWTPMSQPMATIMGTTTNAA